MRNEVEFGDQCFYGYTIGALEFEPSTHRSSHTFEHAETLISVVLSRSDVWLFTYNSLSFYGVDFFAIVTDIPMSSKELDRFVAVVGNFDVVGEYVFKFHRRRFLLKVDGHGLHDDVGGDVEVVHTLWLRYGEMGVDFAMPV